MPAELESISRPGLIICEGPDDQLFLRAMLRYLDIQMIWVEYVEGESQFRAYVRRLRTRSGFETLRALALMRDADTDATAKFSHACSLLRDFNYPVPGAPLEIAHGLLPALESDAVGSAGATGVVIVPTAHSTGALEDLCLEALGDDPSLPCVDEFLRCVETTAQITWPAQYIAKSRLNAWLASRADPRHGLRSAISAGLFSMSHDAFGPIRAFLSQLAEAATGPESAAE
jgi:hypothetical protein